MRDAPGMGSLRMRRATVELDPVPRLIREAFNALVEAENLVYAAGADRETKDHLIAAHSHLLRLKQRFPKEET